MTDQFRALCAELVDALDSGIPAGRIRMSPLADRARALLAQTEPERSASMMDYARQCNTQAVAALVALELLADAADQFGPAGGADGKALAAEVKKARGVLARAALAEVDGPPPLRLRRSGELVRIDEGRVQRGNGNGAPATPKPDIIPKPQFPPPRKIREDFLP